MEEFLLNLLERRAVARVGCAGAAILFFVTAIMFYLASSYWNYASELQSSYSWHHSQHDPIWFERFLEASMFYSLGLGVFFTFLFAWSLTRIPFPRFSWFRLIGVISLVVVSIGLYLALEDEHSILRIMWKDYPLSGITAGVLLVLGGALLFWLAIQRRTFKRDV